MRTPRLFLLAVALFIVGLSAAPAAAQQPPADSLGPAASTMVTPRVVVARPAPPQLFAPGWPGRSEPSLGLKALGIAVETVVVNWAIWQGRLDGNDLSRVERVRFRALPPAIYEPPIPLPPSAGHPPRSGFP